MIGRVARAVVALATVGGLSTGCASLISGTPTWPGATLEKVMLTAADFPPGVQYDRIIEQPGQPDGAGAPPGMLSKPQGCSNALTDVIAASAERGPGSAEKYSVAYDGARIVMTVLSWQLNLQRLEATATRCERFEAFFDPASEGIPITTTKLPGTGQDALAYQQTMRLNGVERSIFMSFANIGQLAVFGIAFPAANPAIPAKASLPQTFLDVVTLQADRMRSV